MHGRPQVRKGTDHRGDAGAKRQKRRDAARREAAAAQVQQHQQQQHQQQVATTRDAARADSPVSPDELEGAAARVAIGGTGNRLLSSPPF